MTDVHDALARLYAGLPGVVRRAGATYPVAVTAVPDGVLVLDDEPVRVDPALAAGGRPHLDALRAGGRVHDGAVLCLGRLDLDASPGVVRVAPGGYFDMLATCDAVRAELVAATGPASSGDRSSPGAATASDGSAGPGAGLDALPLRRRAHAVAGDPVTSGHGRAAAVGVSVLLVVPGPEGAPSVVLGRRSTRVGTDPGRWHVAPSGMLEPSAAGDHLAATVATELREELGVDCPVAQVGAALRVVGVATDLLRLRPDVVVTLDLRALRPELRFVDLRAGEEFDELRAVPVAHLADAWRDLPPDALTAPAAGALALLAEMPEVPDAPTGGAGGRRGG